MNIFQNIIPGIKLYSSLTGLQSYKKEFLAARAAGDIEREKAYILKATTAWGQNFLKVFNVTLNVSGQENLPASGPVVYVCNHQGYADIPVCCAALNTVQFGFVAKSELEGLPLFGDWIKNIRSIMLPRDDARAALRVIDQGIGLIEQSFSLLVFPEGTRSKGGSIGEFKKGSLKIATKPGVPVIPIALNGTYHIFEEKGYIKSGAHVDLVILPAIETKGMTKDEAGNLPETLAHIIRTTFEKIV